MDSYEKKLIEVAMKARENAYAPYSKFKVGAAILSDSGKIYAGANVENASYGLTVCAERVAVFNMVTNGERKFRAICIVTDTKEPVMPCGACRQVLAEFAEDDSVVISVTTEGKIKRVLFKDLLPYQFEFKPE